MTYRGLTFGEWWGAVVCCRFNMWWCGLRGHPWGPWWLEAEDVPYGPATRMCQRCDAWEERESS